MNITRTAVAGVCLIAAFTHASAGAQQLSETAAAEARVLAATIDAGLLTRCAVTQTQADQSGPLNDMVGFIATSTSGANINATYQALRIEEGNFNLCPTARQAVALARQLAVAAICETPDVVANYPELQCATGALANNGGPSATFLTGGAAPPSGSGY